MTIQRVFWISLPCFSLHVSLHSFPPYSLYFILGNIRHKTSRLIGKDKNWIQTPISLLCVLHSGCPRTVPQINRKKSVNVCVCSDEHMLSAIRLSDLHCHQRCPHHHQEMLWLDLHLETYQHEPAVYPGKKDKVASCIHTL